MRKPPAQPPQDTRAGAVFGTALCLVSLAISGCGPSLPQPPFTPVDVADYVEVTSSPRPAPLEFIPPRPKSGAVWVDGSWDYANERFGWRSGTWAMVPAGLRRARWVVVRRKEDGQLFFAPSTWKDESGKNVDDSAWIHALGPDARARTRIDGPPSFDEPPPRRGRAEGAEEKRPPPASIGNDREAPPAPELR